MKSPYCINLNLILTYWLLPVIYNSRHIVTIRAKFCKREKRNAIIKQSILQVYGNAFREKRELTILQEVKTCTVGNENKRK